MRAVADRIGDESPPRSLLAHPPAAQPAFDDLVHLQTRGVVAPAPVRLTRKQRGQVDEQLPQLRARLGNDSAFESLLAFATTR